MVRRTVIEELNAGSTGQFFDSVDALLVISLNVNLPIFDKGCRSIGIQLEAKRVEGGSRLFSSEVLDLHTVRSGCVIPFALPGGIAIDAEERLFAIRRRVHEEELSGDRLSRHDWLREWVQGAREPTS